MGKDDTKHMLGTNKSNDLRQISSGKSSSASISRGSSGGDSVGMTRVYTPIREELQDQETRREAQRAALEFGDVKPVVGWLVIVTGPGRGASHPLHYGNNRIGSDSSQNIRLDYGDEEISRRHAVINFDQRSGRFSARPSEDVLNNIYIDDTVLDESRVISSGTTIELTSKTHARFVAFCGDDFSWES